MRGHCYWLATLALLGASGAPADANAAFAHALGGSQAFPLRTDTGVVTVASTTATPAVSRRMAPVQHAPLVRRPPPPHTAQVVRPVIHTPPHTTPAIVEPTRHEPTVAAEFHRPERRSNPPAIVLLTPLPWGEIGARERSR
jgi:hypothetical protein